MMLVGQQKEFRCINKQYFYQHNVTNTMPDKPITPGARPGQRLTNSWPRNAASCPAAAAPP